MAAIRVFACLLCTGLVRWDPMGRNLARLLWPEGPPVVIPPRPLFFFGRAGLGTLGSLMTSGHRRWTSMSAASAVYLFSGFSSPAPRASNRSLLIITSGVSTLSNMSRMDLLSFWSELSLPSPALVAVGLL